MNYTLITSKGKIYTFFIEAVARTYLQAYGGTLMSKAEYEQCCALQRDAVGEEL